MKAKPYVVLVGMDFSELADRALHKAFDLAAQHADSEVHVLCVVPPPPLEAEHPVAGYWLTAEAGVQDGVFESLRAHVQAELDAFVARREPGARVPDQVVSHVRLDLPARGIVLLGLELNAELIVLGTHGQHGAKRVLLGSVAENAMRHAGCPVLVMPLQPVSAQGSASDEPGWPSYRAPPRSIAHQPSVRPFAE